MWLQKKKNYKINILILYACFRRLKSTSVIFLIKDLISNTYKNILSIIHKNKIFCKIYGLNLIIWSNFYTDHIGFLKTEYMLILWIYIHGVFILKFIFKNTNSCKNSNMLNIKFNHEFYKHYFNFYENKYNITVFRVCKFLSAYYTLNVCSKRKKK